MIATPLAWWLARSRAGFKEIVAAIVSLPMVLPPTVLGFYLLIALGPDGPGGAIASLWGARTLAFTFPGLVIGSIVSGCRSSCSRSATRSPAIGDRRSRWRRRCALRPARLLDRRAAAREPGPAHRRRAGLRPHGRRVRRGADDRRQHSRPDQSHVDRDLRLSSRRCNGGRPTFSPAAWSCSPSS